MSLLQLQREPFSALAHAITCSLIPVSLPAATQLDIIMMIAPLFPRISVARMMLGCVHHLAVSITLSRNYGRKTTKGLTRNYRVKHLVG